MVRVVRRIMLGVGIGFVMLGLLLAVVASGPRSAHYGMTHFTGVGVHQPTEVGTATPALLVNNDGVSNVAEMRIDETPVWVLAADGSLTSDVAQTQAGDLTVSDGDAQVNDFLILDAATAIDCSSDAVITPTGTYQQLTASGATTPTVTTTDVTTGTVLVLINTAAQDVLIQDSGTMMLNTDRTLNQYDSLVLWFDGTNWIEISTTDN